MFSKDDEDFFIYLNKMSQLINLAHFCSTTDV